MIAQTPSVVKALQPFDVRVEHVAYVEREHALDGPKIIHEPRVAADRDKHFAHAALLLGLRELRGPGRNLGAVVRIELALADEEEVWRTVIVHKVPDFHLWKCFHGPG